MERWCIMAETELVFKKEHREIVGDSMSYSTIQRILKNHTLRPHLHKYFLSITDPENVISERKDSIAGLLKTERIPFV